MKKVPIRTCIGCGKERPKKELIRIVRTPEGQICPDQSGRQNGRGAYVCPDPECIRKARRTKGLDRSFREAVPSEAYEALEKEMTLLAGQTN